MTDDFRSDPKNHNPMSAFKRIRLVISRKENLQLTLTALVLQLSFLIGLWISTLPYLTNPPCAICGNPKTKAVKTFWQYRSRPQRYIMEKNIWYCEKHRQNAPKIVTKLPSEKDTVAMRLTIVTVTGSLGFVGLLYTLAMLESNFIPLFIQPALLLLSLFIFGRSSNTSIYLLLAGIVIPPIFIFYFWSKRQS
jgi:hypothetical protein